MNASVGGFISEAARRFDAKTALIFEDRSYTFRDLDEQSSRLAVFLMDLGLRKSDKVSLYGANSPEWLIGYYAIMKIGAVANPLNLMLTPEEVAYAMNDCGARAVIGSDEKIAGLAPVLHKTRLEHRIAWGGGAVPGALEFDALLGAKQGPATIEPVEIFPDDPCTVGYTSGTTGFPKGALTTHRCVMLNVEMTALMHVRTQVDVMATSLPCSHVYGNVAVQSVLAHGGTVVLHKVFDADSFLASIERHRATLIEGVPTMYMYLLESPRLKQVDLSSLTRCTVGGQTMPLAKMQAVEAAFGVPLIELWGMTELGGLGTTHTFYGPRKLGSIGIALPHVQVRIADSNAPAVVLPAGEVGELQVRGPITMREYINNPEATRSTLIDGGWLRTGDLARMDEEGFVYVVDRVKDMIITGGFNIYPAELERAIAEHPAVAMVAVGGIPDEVKGELAKAYIVLKKGLTADPSDLERHCRERLASYKVPRAFQFVDDLPKTSTGKIMRRELKKLDLS